MNDDDVRLVRFVCIHMGRRMGMDWRELIGAGWEGVIRARRTWDGSGSWEAWAKWLIRGSVLNSVKRDDRCRVGEVDEPLDGRPVEVGQPVDGPWVTLLDEERHLLWLRFWEGQTLEEIGEELGISRGAVLGRLTTVLEKLRTYYE